MCRWVAYLGVEVPLEQYVIEPEHSLVAQSMHAVESNAATNGDGFGLGWYGGHAEPGVYREVRPAWSDDNLRHLCRHLRSHLFFAHVRASTGTPISRQNCHPFAWGRWMFMHNGIIDQWPRTRRMVEALIPDSLYASRTGTTDSEALFLAMVGAGLMTDDDAAVDPVAVAAATLGRVAGLVEAGGHAVPIRFTAALTDGDTIYAFRHARNDAANSLYFSCSDDGVVVVSEPLDWGQGRWTAVPNHSVVIARKGQPVEVLPFARPDG